MASNRSWKWLGGSTGSSVGTRKAVDYFRQQQQLANERGDQGAAGQALSHLGSVYTDLGEYPQAVSLLEEALGIALEVDDRREAMKSQWGIGYCYLQQRDYRRALQHFCPNGEYRL